MNQPQPDTHEVEDGSLDAEVNQRLVKTLEDSAAGTGIAVLAANVLTWLWGV